MKKKTARSKPSRGKAPKKKAERAVVERHRVNTHKANGSASTSMEVAPAEEPKITIGEAMRRAVEDLGEVVVDDQLAPEQMRDLGTAFEEVTRRQAAFNAKADEAKTAKKGLESAQELLLEKVRSYTHPKPLPLFDMKQAEDDREDMLDAVDAQHDAEAAN